MLSNGFAGTNEGRKIRLMSKIHRCRNSYDNIVGPRQLGRVGGGKQVTRRLQFIDGNFAGRIDALLITLDFAAGKIIAYGRLFSSNSTARGNPT